MVNIIHLTKYKISISNIILLCKLISKTFISENSLFESM